jgi:hypothetical protein
MLSGIMPGVVMLNVVVPWYCDISSTCQCINHFKRKNISSVLSDGHFILAIPNVIMLRVIVLNVVTQNVVRLSVVAPAPSPLRHINSFFEKNPRKLQN